MSNEQRDFYAVATGDRAVTKDELVELVDYVSDMAEGVVPKSGAWELFPTPGRALFDTAAGLRSDSLPKAGRQPVGTLFLVIEPDGQANMFRIVWDHEWLWAFVKHEQPAVVEVVRA